MNNIQVLVVKLELLFLISLLKLLFIIKQVLLRKLLKKGFPSLIRCDVISYSIKSNVEVSYIEVYLAYSEIQVPLLNTTN